MKSLSIILASLTSLFQSAKYGTTKYLLTDYSNTTSILNMVFIKHIIKSLLYIIIILFLSNENMYNIINNLNTLVVNSFNNNNKSLSILIGLTLVACFEISLIYPYYHGLRLFNLNSYILMITVFTIFFNIIFGYIYLNEKFNTFKIIGIIICIIGIILIKLS